MNCNHCGTALPEGAAVCTVCGTAVPAATVSPAELPAKERVGLGILGAVIGALIGAASIVLLDQLGYVAALSGVLMAFTTLKGYELLAKKLSKTGVIISVLLMVVVTFLANTVCLGLDVYAEIEMYGATLMDAFMFLPELFLNDGIDFGAYFTNLGMLYAFVALGAFSLVRNAFRSA